MKWLIESGEYLSFERVLGGIRPAVILGNKIRRDSWCKGGSWKGTNLIIEPNNSGESD